MREIDDITAAIVDASLQIHRDLGPGLLESVYETLLARTLVKRGFHVECQMPMSFQYDGLVFEEAFRTDIIVENQVIVELKSVERLAPVHGKQLLTYLKLTNKSVGLLINFGDRHFKGGSAPRRQSTSSFPFSASPRESTTAG